MQPILVSVFAALPVFKPPEAFEPEWLVPADATFTGGANYVAINKVTGKRYEGESVNFHKRIQSTQRNHEANEKTNRRTFYNSMRKYGIENLGFIFRKHLF